MANGFIIISIKALLSFISYFGRIEWERESQEGETELLIHNLIQNRNSNALPSLSALESRAKNNTKQK